MKQGLGSSWYPDLDRLPVDLSYLTDLDSSPPGHDSDRGESWCRGSEKRCLKELPVLNVDVTLRTNIERPSSAPPLPRPSVP